jgi:hypothetical protein
VAGLPQDASLLEGRPPISARSSGQLERTIAPWASTVISTFLLPAFAVLAGKEQRNEWICPIQRSRTLLELRRCGGTGKEQT